MPEAPRLTIIGLGLRGTSLGLAVRAAKTGWRVVGHDLDHGAAGRAKKLGALDAAEWNLPAAVETADLVVVATPASAVASVLRDIADLLRPGCVVTDLAPTKIAILRSADEILPATVSFVGGHPLVEPTEPEIADAKPDADVFRDREWCIVPSERASSRAVDRVSGLVRAVGALPLFVEADEHDSYVAATLGLPVIIATALANAVLAGSATRDLDRFAGEGLRAATRAVGGSTSALADAALLSGSDLRRWLDAFRAELDDLASLLASAAAATDDAKRAEIAGDLGAVGASARAARERWLAARVDRDRNSVVLG